MTRGVFTAATTITATGHNDVWDPPRCRLWNSANISHTTSGTLQALTFDTETYDVGGMHSTSVNTSRITVPTDGAGTYDIGGSIQWATNATGYREIAIRVNGTTIISYSRVPNSGGVDGSRVAIHTQYRLAVGDFVELLANQNSGGALNVVAGSLHSPVFYAKWCAI